MPATGRTSLRDKGSERPKPQMLEPMRWQRVERSCGAWPVRLLVDQTPRDQETLRGVLQARLGAHYEI